MMSIRELRKSFAKEHAKLSTLESQYEPRLDRMILVKRVKGDLFTHITVPVLTPDQLFDDEK